MLFRSKENVIIGKLIPAGSGLAAYRKLDEIEDEDHNDGRFRDVAVMANDLREDDEPTADSGEDEEELNVEVEEDEVLSISLDDEDDSIEM